MPKGNPSQAFNKGLNAFPKAKLSQQPTITKNVPWGRGAKGK